MKRHLKKHAILYFSFLIFLLPFLVTRLPFFLNYPVVHFDPDDAGYYQLVDQMNKGFWPHPAIRTLGFPLFLKLVFLFSDRNFSVVAVQHLLTLFSCGLFIFVFYRLYGDRKFIPPLTAAALAAYATSCVHLAGDCTLLSDSLFANLVLLSLAGLAAGIGHRRGTPFLFASLAMGAAILVRPAGIFFLVVYLAVLAFLLINRLPRRTLLAFLVPFPAVLAAISLYDRLSVGTFALSTFSEHALISFASSFLEKDASLGPAAAEAVTYCRRGISDRRLQAMAQIWDYDKLRRISRRYYNDNRIMIGRIFFEHEPAGTYDLYLKWRPVWRRLALQAIRRHPRLACKYFYSVFMTHFYSERFNDVNFYVRTEEGFKDSRSLHASFSYYNISKPASFFNRRFNTAAYARTLSDDFISFMLKEYDRPPAFRFIRQAADGSVQLQPTFWLRLHYAYNRMQHFLFRNGWWILVYLLAAAAALYRLFATRGRHGGAFILFLLVLAFLAYGLIVTASGYTCLRYSYVMEYVLYFCSFGWCLAWLPDPAAAGKGESASS
jgi:hypothetical protein